MHDKPTHAELQPLPPNLLKSVLDYTDRSTQVSCARVCKGWHEVVISVLWHRVDDIGRLLRVFRVNGAQPYIIPGACWTRVFHYSNYIKELTVGPNGLENLLEAIIPSIHVHSLYLTPNLESLCWKSQQPLQYSLLFLPPCLSSLSVDEWNSFALENDRYRLIQTIMERCPNMISFDYSWTHNNHLAHAMIELISDRRGSLMNRRWKVDAMGFGNTVPDVSDETMGLVYDPRPPFGMFQILGKLDQHPASKYAGSVTNLMGLKSSPIFSGLREVYLRLYSDEARAPPMPTNLMLHGMPVMQYHGLVPRPTMMLPGRIMGLHRDVYTSPRGVYPYDNNHRNSLYSLCTAIADSACQVEIVVISSESSALCMSPPTAQISSISFRTFQPLLRCRFLTTFVILTPFPVAISDSELENLAEAWPSLQHLYLSPLATAPQHVVHELPSLGVICSLPMHCPNLRSLSLLVTPDTSWKACLRPFSQLKNLHLSFSEGRWDDAEVASTIIEATLGSCTILLHPSASRYPDYSTGSEASAHHADSVRRIQQDISYWRAMRNRCLEALVIE